MASEWNRALKTASRVLKNRLDGLGQYEGANREMVDDRRAPGLRTAISEVQALIEPEEE